MSQRVIIALDVTFDEAKEIAERIAGVGPYYEAWNLPVALDEAEERADGEGQSAFVCIRSDASVALGGADAFDQMFPDPD